MKTFLMRMGRVITLVVCNLGMVMQVCALDLPNFYRASFFQTEPTDKTKDWATLISARLAAGKTSHSYNVHEDRRPLFSQRGPFNLVRLGIGLQTPGPLTQTYWNQNQTGIFDNLTNLGPNDGMADYSGRFKINEYDFELKQNLFWGFYLHGYLPVRDIKIDHIKPHRRGAEIINTSYGPVNMDTFISEKLPVIMHEAGLKPMRTFKKSGVSDGVVSLGWQKSAELSKKEFLTSLSGFAQAGFLIAGASQADVDNSFAVPLGYNHDYAALIQGGLETCVLNFVTVGLQGEATIFIRDNARRRLMTDKNKQQNGWIILEKPAWVGNDQGTVWDVGVYARFDKLFKGFYATIGYSYTKQETTIYRVKQNWFLQTVIEQNQNEANWGTNYYMISQNNVANGDRRLRGWNTQTLHLLAGYDASVLLKSWGPFIRIEYDYPFLSKFMWPADMIGGTLGVSATWNF